MPGSVGTLIALETDGHVLGATIGAVGRLFRFGQHLRRTDIRGGVIETPILLFEVRIVRIFVILIRIIVIEPVVRFPGSMGVSVIAPRTEQGTRTQAPLLGSRPPAAS